MWQKFQKKVNEQSIVEQPEIYIVAQCQDNIAEKLSYVGNRREDTAELSIPLSVGDIKINDKLRFFTGLIFKFTKNLNTYVFQRFFCLHLKR